MILMVTKFGVAVGRVIGSRYHESLNFDERVIFEGLIETLLFSWKILILVSGYWLSSLICLVCSCCVGMGIAILPQGAESWECGSNANRSNFGVCYCRSRVSLLLT